MKIPPPAPIRLGARPTRTVHVRCVNLACTDPADTDVHLAEVAPGAVQRPDLQCATCGFILVTEVAR